VFEKKKFMLNCSVCDARKIKEEDYNRYEQILVNTDVMLVTDKSKSIINSLPMVMNADSVIKVDEDIEVSLKSVNGFFEISGTTGVSDNTILTVNGAVNILPGTESVLEKYTQICINGHVLYPKSLESYLSRMSINGAAVSYPDDCVLLDSDFEIDKYFPIRAKQDGKYYVDSKVIVKDKSVDLKKMVEKNVQFVTKQLIIHECLVEDGAILFDEKVKFVIVPDDMEIVQGDVELNDVLLKQYGSKLFVIGNVTLTDESTFIMEKLDALEVKGTVNLKQHQVEDFEKINAKYDNLNIVKGRLFENAVNVTLDKSIFDHSPEGIKVRNVARVKVATDVSVETILNDLQTENCAMIVCEENQRSAVEAVSVNVATILSSEDDKGLVGNALSSMFNQMKDTKMVNADRYVM